MKWPNIKYKIGENHLCRSVFFVTQISQMRPVRSLQIPPEVGKSPTDFTDLHRFFHRSFLSHRFHRYTQIFIGTFFKSRRFRRWRRFFLMGFLFIGFHGIYSEVDCWDDYSRIFADATCPVVADTPWGWTKRFTRDSIENLCKSVKSVGQNPPTKKNLRHLRNLRDKK